MKLKNGYNERIHKRLWTKEREQREARAKKIARAEEAYISDIMYRLQRLAHSDGSWIRKS